MKNYLLNKPWLLFAPFLAAFLFMIFRLNYTLPIVLMGDEPRYLEYAQNLLNGYFSAKGKVDLWSGPGYPLFLAPFIKIGFDVNGLRLLNAFLQYISIVYLFKTLKHWVSIKYALGFAFFWGFYFIAYKEMLYVYTETLTSLLVVLIAYKISNAKKYIDYIFIGLLLGYLAIVKIIFGYVILFCLGLFAIIYLIKKQQDYLKFSFVFLVAFISTIPYLFYTYNLTGKAFYWGNSGGMSLYWMSTPIETEYGDWNDSSFSAYCNYDTTMPCNAKYFAKSHQADYDSIYKFNGIQRDEAFKQKAFQNIQSHPVKYVKNIFANAGRLFFGIPNSYNFIRFQHLWRIIPNTFVFCMFLISIVLGIRKFNKIHSVFYFLLTVLFAYLGLTLLVSAQQRQLYVVLPIILLWFAWIFERSFQLRDNL